MQFYSGSGGGKIAFLVKPGADPDDIGLRFEGQDDIALDVYGNLKLLLGNKWIELKEAVAYQYDANNNIVPVNWTAGYETAPGADHVSFQFGQYDTSLPLVLLIGHLPAWQAEQSAGLCWSTYLGGGN